MAISKARRFPGRPGSSAGRVLAGAAIGFLCIFGPADVSAAEGGPAALAFNDLTEMSLESLMNVSVYSASKYEQKATEAPSSVSVVTAEEIRKFGYRTLADILKSLRSFYSTYDRNYNYIGVRGFAPPGDFNTRLLLLVDGHRINDGIYDTAVVGTEFILDVDLIDRVEVIRGPSSSLYGSNAFFGVINVITRRGKDLKGIEVSGEAASFGTFKGRTTYGNRFGSGLEVLLSGTVFRSEGQNLFFPEFNDPATNNGIAEKRDGDKFQSFFSTFAYRDFTFQAAYISREKTIPTGSYGTVFNDPRNRTVDDRYYADLKYDGNFDEKTSIAAKVFYDWYGYRGDYVFSDNAINPVPPFLFVNKDDTRNAWWGAEAKLTRRMLETHRLTVGVEYRDYFRQDQGNFDENPSASRLDDKRSTRIWAIYLQDEFEIAKGLILNAGIRHDQYSTFGGTTNPRVALIYNPRPKTTLKLLYGKAFRAPNVFEMFYTDGEVTQKANPALGPEKIETVEGVIEQSIGDHLRLLAAGYSYKITDLITQKTDPVDTLLLYRNVAPVRTRGVETELNGRWGNGLEGRASYTYQETTDGLGQSLINSPRHLAKLNLIAPLLTEKVFAGGETHRGQPDPVRPEPGQGAGRIGRRLQPLRLPVRRPDGKQGARGHPSAGWPEFPDKDHISVLGPGDDEP
ncbi:MAG: outer membrane receptor for ferrienterochelin and colicin [Actinobacteria bacterium]|nr:outer membrane receptor for ferrienterochelin and colicin [Actinomycetota bacterium]